MCQKTKTFKHFFVLLNHPLPLQKPLVMGVLKQSPLVTSIYETSRNSVFLSDAQIKELGYTIPTVHQSYLLPIQIPRDWFIY
jgi:hypothetical protein